ncbi:MAG: hypothetical protein ABEJ70_00650 [Halobacteriaceae archaeon]
MTAVSDALWLSLTRGAAASNVLLLLGLLAIWGRNLRRYRSRYTAGLVTVAALLLAENLLSVYMYLLDPGLTAWLAGEYTPTAGLWAMALLHCLETAALAVLVWSSWS